MKTFSIMDAAAEPFRQAGRRPLATMVWGLVVLAPSLLVLGAMIPLLADLAASGAFDAEALEAAGPGASPFDDDMAAMVQWQLWSNLANLVGMLTYLVVTTAIIRAVNAGRKSDRAFFLRVGMAEFQVAVVGVAVGVGFSLVALVAVLLGVGVGFAVWQLGDPWRWPICILGGLAMVVALLTLWGRLSLLAPATIRYRTFAFEEGWKLGRGQSRRLLGLWIVLLLIALLVGIAFMILLVIVLMAVGGGVQATDPEAVEAWVRGLPQQPVLLAGLAIVLLIPLAWLQGFSQALFTAPYARVVQALAGSVEPETVAEEFH